MLPSVDNDGYIKYDVSKIASDRKYMDVLHTLREISTANGGIIETRTAGDAGISRSLLSKLCKAGRIRRITSGQYGLPDVVQDDFVSVVRSSGKAIYSHETALYLNHLSDHPPAVHSVTVPSGHKPSSHIKTECRIYYLKPDLFDLGKTALVTPSGNNVPSYNPERTICDIVRSRNRVGSEIFLDALRKYASSPYKDLDRLDNYAQLLHIANVLRLYREVLL